MKESNVVELSGRVEAGDALEVLVGLKRRVYRPAQSRD